MGKGLTKPLSYDIIGVPKDERGNIKLLEFIVYFLNQVDLPMLINDLRISIDLLKMLIGKG